MTDDGDVVLRSTNLTVGFSGVRGRTIAAGLNLHLARGRLVCLLGPNGSGKTTILRTLAGLLTPLSGDVVYRGRSVRDLSRVDLARERSVVLTHPAAVGMLTVRELVSLGRLPYADWMGRLSAADEQAVQRCMATTACEPIADRRMHEISDGERQRAFIARALAQDASVLLLDEPTAFLDLPRRVEIVRLLVRLAHGDRRAVALSTHDLDLALQSADELWLISKEGQLRTGLPEELVLDGSFERAFAAEGCRFDRTLGRFVWRDPEGPRVRMRTDSASGVWVAHGLRRIGYTVVDFNESAEYSVEGRDGGWIWTGPGGTRQFDSLREFLLAAERDRLAVSGPGSRG